MTRPTCSRADPESLERRFPAPASFAELFISLIGPATGAAVVGEDIVLTVRDGELLKRPARADKDGRFSLVNALSEYFPHGQFTMQAERKGKAGASPSADFSKGYTDDEDEERQLREGVDAEADAHN